MRMEVFEADDAFFAFMICRLLLRRRWRRLWLRLDFWLHLQILVVLGFLEVAV